LYVGLYNILLFSRRKTREKS